MRKIFLPTNSVSLCMLCSDVIGIQAFSFVHMLPLDGFGFGWAVPTALAALAGLAISRLGRAGGRGRGNPRPASRR